jgi:hypothetical protein
VTLDDADLRSALDDLAAHVAWPDDAVDITARALDSLERRPVVDQLADRRVRRVRWMAAVVAAAATLVVVVVVPPAREAVADLLGLGGVRITVEDRPRPPRSSGSVEDLDLGRPVGLDEATRLAVAPLPIPAGLDEPDAAYAGRPLDGVTLAWRPTGSLPDVLGHGYGLLISVFPGTVDEDVIEKRIYKGGTVERTSVNGDPAYWIGGAPHEFEYLGAEGDWQHDSIRLSGNALIWTHAGVTYRLESALTLADTLALAESIPTQ